MTSSSNAPTSAHRDGGILCIGEVLWDSLPEGLFLGGALFNVAAHLHALHEPSTLVSRVGDDVLGEEVLRRMRSRGMSTDLVQVDSELRTGFVRVALDDEGAPHYEIAEPVAWDAITWTDALKERAAAARAVVIGSLSQRNEVSFHTVQSVCHTTDGLVVYDVNLRPPHTSHPIVEASLHHADVIKLNADELRQLQQWFDLSDELRAGIPALAERFGLRACCVTHGAEGATLWSEGSWSTHPGYNVEVRDTVGAGDAFLAAFLAGYLGDHSEDTLLDLANRLGAYVASHSGALPEYTFDGLEELEQSALNTVEKHGENK